MQDSCRSITMQDSCRSTTMQDTCRSIAMQDSCRSITMYCRIAVGVSLCRIAVGVSLCRIAAGVSLCRIAAGVSLCRLAAGVSLCIGQLTGRGGRLYCCLSVYTCMGGVTRITNDPHHTGCPRYQSVPQGVAKRFNLNALFSLRINYKVIDKFKYSTYVPKRRLARVHTTQCQRFIKKQQ